MLRKIILLLLVSFAFVNTMYGLSVDESKQIILQQNKEEFSEAAYNICLSKDPQTLSFVAAIVENRLYKSDSIALTKFAGDDVYYTLFTVPQEPFQSKNITAVKVSRKQRSLFKALKKYTTLVNPKAEVRAMGYVSFVQSGVNDDIEVINALMNVETDPSVLLNAQYAKWGIAIRLGDAVAQDAALSAIEGGDAAVLLTTLEAYVLTDGIDPVLKDKAQHTIDHILRHERVVKFVQNLFSGISLGSILLLVALGLSIVYGLGGIINMSHGEFVMIGAYTTYCMQELFISYMPAAWFDAFFIVSIPLSFLVAGVFGLILERLVIKHLYSRPAESLLATWGISLILIQLCRSIFGDVTAVKSPAFLSGGVEVMDGLIFPYSRLFIIGLTCLMVFLTYLVFNRSRLGLKIRAVTQNRDMSSCLGVRTDRVDSISFFLGSGLAGVAGCAMTLIGNVVPDMGQTFIVDSFLVVVTGGVGKLAGTIVSAMGIGVLSKFFEFLFQAVYGKVILLGIIIFFLQYKPKGLFPDKGRHADD